MVRDQKRACDFSICFHRYPQYLAKKGYAPTTIKNMLCNVVLFVQHIDASYRSASNLSQEKLSEILEELNSAQADLLKTVRVHRDNIPHREARVDAGHRENVTLAQTSSSVSTRVRLSAHSYSL